MSGFEPVFMPDYLFDFQQYFVEWALKKGRAAIFADCGLGKSVIELVWAENIVRKYNGNVLLLTPLAVGQQMLKEADKFGIEARRSKDGKVKGHITITNYERLHYFNPSDFIGMVCDESSILKNFNGATKNKINIFIRKIQFRLLATATAAPNDFIELGTSSEALGYLGYTDMLTKFFKNENNTCAAGRFYRDIVKWRLKGHAHDAFWRWVVSWSRSMRSPSDMGFENEGYDLLPLKEIEHELDIIRQPNKDMLFALPAVGLKEVRDERRATIKKRCEKAAEIINETDKYAIVWCNLNDEGNLLEKLIPDAIQVSGSDKDDLKEDKLTAFSNGDERVLITKPKIGAWGLNWQHCSHVVFFPAYSYEQYYQAIRRCWRFGQKQPVNVDLIYTYGDRHAIKNLRRKQRQADKMFDNLVKEMNNSLAISNKKEFLNRTEIPSWA
jgi:SNF2 family DNA or RNA helicase